MLECGRKGAGESWRAASGTGMCVEKPDDLGIADLAKVVIPGADPPKRRGRQQGDGAADATGARGFGGGCRSLGVQFGDGTGWGDGDSGYDCARLALDQCVDGGAHGGSCGQTVVDEEDGAAPDWGGRAPAAEKLGAAGEFMLLLARDLPDAIIAQLLLGDDLPVDHLDAAFGNRAEGQLSLARHTEFAYEPDVEGGIQDAGDLAGNRNASPREAENEGKDSILLSEHGPEQRAGVAAVSETLGHATPLPSLITPLSIAPGRD